MTQSQKQSHEHSAFIEWQCDVTVRPRDAKKYRYFIPSHEPWRASLQKHRFVSWIRIIQCFRLLLIITSDQGLNPNVQTSLHLQTRGLCGNVPRKSGSAEGSESTIDPVLQASKESAQGAHFRLRWITYPQFTAIWTWSFFFSCWLKNKTKQLLY